MSVVTRMFRSITMTAPGLQRALFSLSLTCTVLLALPAAFAADFGTGPLPVAFEPSSAVSLPKDDTIVIDGTVSGSGPATIVLRIDDGASKDYASRMNDERKVAPGPFSLRIPTSALRATNGRALDTGSITRVILFVHGEGTAAVTKFALASGKPFESATPQQSSPPAVTTANSGTVAAPKAFQTGPLPMEFEPPNAVAIPGGKILRIDGAVSGSGPVTLVLRIDDGASRDYASRMNDERVIQPGPFSWRIDTSRLRTTNGRPLDLNTITRVILFVNGDGAGALSRFDIADKSDTAPAPPAPRVDAPLPQKKVAAIPAPRTYSTGRLPQIFESSSSLAFADDDELILEGTVQGTRPAAVAVRIDDDKSSSYASRYNDERMLPPGPFRMTLGLKGLRTPSGRILDHGNARRMFVFIWKDEANVMLTKFAIEKGISLPPNAVGYSLGAPDAALPSGFVRIAPGDSRIEARGKAEIIRRPAPDPIIANGLRGIRKLTLPTPAGRVRVTVWSEDPGEWEELPRELDRRITVNGRELRAIKTTADAWIAQRYLRGRTEEHSATDDAWTAYGRYRGHRRHIDIDNPGSSITIELSGADPSAYFLSAALVEPLSGTPPADDSAGQTAVDARRAEWYRNKYPVVRTAPEENERSHDIALDLAAPSAAASPPIALVVAPDTGVRARLVVTAKSAIAKPQVTVTMPRLITRVWAGSPRLERDDTTLRLTDNFLRSDISNMPLRAGAPRTYEIWIDAPKSASPGRHSGHVTIGDGVRSQRIPIEVTVVPVTLPGPEKPAGFYLARAPHLAYFNGLAIERDRQVKCDLDLFRTFGMANTAPPIAGLDRTELGLYAIDMRRAAAAGVAPGWLVYNPLHALLEKNGPERAAAIVARLEDVARGIGGAPPLWSVADEPSNPDQGAGGLDAWIKALRKFAPSAKLGGHLNSPSDETFVPLFDTLIINPAFGIDRANVARLTKAGKSVWFYNTFQPRLTAGLWLWNTTASRYVQWHARMPTADPFDPLDGREADFQVIYPDRETCSERPDVHRDFLRMAEGIVDQRWLTWLSKQTTAEARALVGEFRSAFAGPFPEHAKSSSRTGATLRDKIIRLAAPDAGR